MTYEEILTKAIEKAIANGWTPLVDGAFIEIARNQFTGEPHIAQKAPWNREKWALGQSVASILLDHNFAKALWPGVTEEPDMVKTEYWLYNWQYHLQQMVIAEDPIAYLGAHG